MLRMRAASLAGVAVLLASAPLYAVVTPDGSSPVAQKEFRHPGLSLHAVIQRGDGLSMARFASDLGRFGVSPQHAQLDLRSGRWATLLSAEPLIPGTGVGNTLSWQTMGLARPATDAGYGEMAWKALTTYLSAHDPQLSIELRELGRPGIGVHGHGDVVQIYAPRSFEGVPVRDSYLTAVVNHGNLVLFGAHRWGTIAISTLPAVPEAQAAQTVANHVAPLTPTGYRAGAELAIVSLSTGAFDPARQLGQGYDYRLVWVLSPRFAAETGNWEAVVDARSGELISFLDTNAYQTARKVVGGVYPVSNDGAPPDGVEQPGTPMPFAYVANGGNSYTTDTGGNAGVCLAGDITMALRGPFIAMADQCGVAAETSPTDLDLSEGPGTDCVVPAGHSAGDTHASRTVFYELNKLKEQARGQLPDNAWLRASLTVNTNIPNVCNAFWDGAAIVTYKSGGGCSNSGELAGLFDHEWGHGLDDNDVTGTLSNPSEGTADIYAALRTETSCIGRNFFLTGQCGGYGDPCVTGCSGVRDLDFANHQSGLPHDIPWVQAHCGSGSAPCGGGAHCEGAIPGEAVWDLFHRDLPSVFGMGTDTALEVAVRDAYIGMGLIGDWYTCTQGSGGCPADSGYMNFLAADDDNGNLTDGTPHMQALFQAFDRHGVACPVPVVSNTGCAGAPTAAPVVVGAAQDRGASLAWGAVPGAVKYRVYRTEGALGCDFGKALVGETHGTTFADSGLQDGRSYFYGVMAVGLSETCLGPMSSCTTVTPASGSNLSVDAGSASMSITGGDGDPFLDNCENATVAFNVANIGSATATNLRINAVQPLSHPAMPITGISAPIPSAAPCSDSPQSFTFRAVDLAPDDPVRFRVDVTSDELFPAVRSAVLQLAGTEGDSQFMATQTSDFETDAAGWTLVSGTFDRTSVPPGGAGGAGTFYFQSSASLGNQCDEIHSPIISLTASSTLQIQNRFTIEGMSAGSFYDRANVARVSEATGARTVVAPSSGRLYNVDTAGGPCGMTGDVGWAGTMDTWSASGWNPIDLGAPGILGHPIRIDVKYGTDPLTSLAGFKFDQVTLTDFNLKVADTQSDVCTGGNQSPVAVADASGSGTLGLVTVPVLANDSDPDGNCLRVTAVTTPGAGSAFINFVGCGTDTVSYVPNLSCGNPCNDSFQYTVSDGQGGTANATVSITQTTDAKLELVHGSSVHRNLAAAGGVARQDFLPIRTRAAQSWEVVVDEATGDIVGSGGPNLVRVDSDFTTVIQTAAPIGTGVSKSLRWENNGATSFDNYARVSSAGCTTDCTAEDAYRIRAYDTTYSIARFNNSATQVTVLVIQNTSVDPVTGTVWLWNAAGALVSSQPLTLAANSTLVLNTSGIAPGVGGTITVTTDGRYGSLSGKAVAVEPATGFTFDTAMTPKGR
jgi:hypothetical protein